MSERRRNDRVKATVEVSLSSEHNFYTGFTQDISEGGVFVAGIDTLPIGTEVEFDLKLGRGTVRVTGVVRWVRVQSEYVEAPAGMGLEFRDLHPAAAQKINDFIAAKRDAIFYDDDL